MKKEQCTFLQDTAVDCLQTSFLDTDQLSLLNGIDMPAKSSENVQQMDGSLDCKCGKGTYECLIHPSTPDKWTAYMRDSLASLLASPEVVRGLQMKEANSSRRLFAVLKQSDPNKSFSKMCQDLPQASPHLAYAAGLIDGEGCIRIQKQSNKQTYIVVVQLAMTNKATVIREALETTFGGNSYEMEFKNKKWAKQWQWRINGEKACDLLSQILPFLVLKKKQAELALQLNEMRKAEGWTEKTRAIAEQMKQQMHELNMKGPNALNAEQGWYQTSPDIFGTWNRYSEPWPRSGMTVNGFAYELPIVGRTITEIDGGYLPTPTTISNHLAPSMMKHKGCRNLVKAMQPTPTAHNAKECAAPSEGNRNTPTLGWELGGRPNPQYTAWMMGWPLDFNALKGLETVNAHCKRHSHTNCLEETE